MNEEKKIGESLDTGRPSHGSRDREGATVATG
jgi:hypothetical protein